MKNSKAAISIAALALALAACSGEQNQTGASADSVTESASSQSDEITVSAAELEGNPFTVAWETPYGAPPFSQITDDHYMPATKAAILELREEIDAIVNNADEPTFENTIVALDLVGKQINKVAGTFGNITNTDTNDALRELEGQIYKGERRKRSTDPIWSVDVYKIKNRFIKNNQPTLYYLDGGPKRSFVFEELQPIQDL